MHVPPSQPPVHVDGHASVTATVPPSEVVLDPSSAAPAASGVMLPDSIARPSGPELLTGPALPSSVPTSSWVANFPPHDASTSRSG